jgi:hypothetical protein
MIWLAMAALAQEPPEVNERTQAAIQRGLDHLAKQQASNGSLRSSYPEAAASLAGLAWLASGDTADRGRYAENIRSALKFILRCTGRDGYISAAGGSGAMMHGHGYGVLFLAQAAGTTADPELREEVRDALARAVRLIERTQNSYGGWNSLPNRAANDDGSGAIAVMQIMGLRAARDVGIAVDAECIARAKKYLREMTDAAGWYQYNYHMRTSGRRSSALTGAGMYMLGAFDLYGDPVYARGIRNLMEAAPFLHGGQASGDGGWSGWYLYTGFYASLAIFQHGGEEWKRWWPAMRDDLLRQQSSSGAWPDGYGGIYTALALLTLELPYRQLPVFQAGGAGREGE